jgi:molybdopterin synthase catalytic subunit
MASEDPVKQKEVRKYLQQSHDRIFDNNKKWAEEMKKKKPEFFQDLTAGQSPEYLWIGESIAFISVTSSHRTDSWFYGDSQHLKDIH